MAAEGSVLGPATLAESLPSHEATFQVGKGIRTAPFSDAVVVGRVAKVSPSEAVVYDVADADGEPRARTVPYDDPNADERSLVVTLTESRSLGGEAVSQTLTFRLGVLAGSDPTKFLAAARSLERVAVLLKVRPDGRHQGEWIPAIGPAGIGTVGKAGAIRFPGMGTKEKAFQDGIDTIDELSAAAQR